MADTAANIAAETKVLVYRPALDYQGSGVPNGTTYLDGNRMKMVIRPDDHFLTPDGNGGSALIAHKNVKDDTLIVATYKDPTLGGAPKTGLIEYSAYKDPYLSPGIEIHITNIRDGNVEANCPTTNAWHPDHFTAFKLEDSTWVPYPAPQDNITPIVMKPGEEWLFFGGASDWTNIFTYFTPPYFTAPGNGKFDIGPATSTHKVDNFDQVFATPAFDGTGMEYLSFKSCTRCVRMFDGCTLKPDADLDMLVYEMNSPKAGKLNLASMFNGATWYATNKPFATVNIDRSVDPDFNVDMSFMFKGFKGSYRGLGLEEMQFKGYSSQVNNMFQNAVDMDNECIDLSHWEVNTYAGWLPCNCCQYPTPWTP